MKIGLTYDLRSDYLAAGYSPEATAEFDSEQTIDAIESALRASGHTTTRLGRLHALVPALASPDGLDVELVFNICEGMHGIGREAQVPALLDGFGVPYTFSDPLVLALTLHKGMTKRVVRDMGVPTAPFAVVESRDDARAIDLPFPLFVKPIAEGTSKGVSPRSRVGTRGELVERCAELLDQFRQPVLVETFLPGREVTVGVVGTGAAARAIGTMEVRIKPGVEDDIYSQALKEDWHGRLEYVLAETSLAAEAEPLALLVWRGLGCRDGGRVDFRADASGRLQFLEVNPLAGLHPLHSDLPILWSLTGGRYEALIAAIVDSARERCLVERRSAPLLQ